MSLLSMRHVTHHFAGLRAVSDFNLELQPGDLAALIGPNGAGKTTVFNILSGVYRPTSGQVSFDGRDIVGHRPHQIVARGVARTFQNIRLFRNLSALDNMRIAQHGQARYSVLSSMLRLPSFRREEQRMRARSLELLELFGLADVADAQAGSLPYGQQ
ncbi:MAG TPA: high-affinity branched-chain amino acid ABC transporter ATP-binding protein LivG, partial [Armatimonadetes bacterium]|nr:high-affinity branched-chain amino acid ABC transporter ATP-binding protein LivG [Armatimonadota bacterium]